MTWLVGVALVIVVVTALVFSVQLERLERRNRETNAILNNLATGPLKVKNN